MTQISACVFLVFRRIELVGVVDSWLIWKARPGKAPFLVDLGDPPRQRLVGVVDSWLFWKALPGKAPFPVEAKPLSWLLWKTLPNKALVVL